MSDITNRIEILYKQKGFTRVDFCKKNNIPITTYRRWMEGSSPSAETLYRVSKFLGVSLDFLVSGESPVELTDPVKLLSYQEQKLIEQFRALDDHDKNSVITLAAGLLSQYSSITGKSSTVG